MELGKTNSYIHDVTNIDLWFIEKLRNIMDFENDFLKDKKLFDLDRDLMLHAKQLGFSDQQIAKLTNSEFFEVRSCLLYTSPSPRDEQSSRMPSSA